MYDYGVTFRAFDINISTSVESKIKKKKILRNSEQIPFFFFARCF